MATFEKDSAAGGEQASPEFLRKLDSLKKKDSAGASQKDSGSNPDDQPPAELLRKLEALKRGSATAAVSQPDPNVSAEFLKKLDAVQKGTKTGDLGKSNADQGVSPELLRKLNAIATRKNTPDLASQDIAEATGAPVAGSASPPPAPSASSAPPAPAVTSSDGAIEKAIELMRQLPINDQNVELMMQVVKSTLESFNINIDGIIAEAAKKRRDLEHRIQTLQQEVANFEEEIRKRTGIIHGLRRQYEEITLVGDRLLIGQKRARQGNPEIGSHLSDSELWGADDEETSAALDALLPGANPQK